MSESTRATAVEDGAPDRPVIVLCPDEEVARRVADALTPLLSGPASTCTAPAGDPGSGRPVDGGVDRAVAVLVPIPLAETARRLRAGGAADASGDTANALVALAEREQWHRGVLASLEGSAVYVLAGDEVRSAPTPALQAFLEGQGIAPAGRRSRRGSGLPAGADPGGGTATGSSERDADELLLPEMRALDARLDALAGAHERFHADLGPASLWSAALVDRERSLHQLFGGLEWAAGQIEPFVRATRADLHSPEAGGRRRSVGRYPLTASQDMPAYHRWLRRHGFPTSVGGAGTDPVRVARTEPGSGSGPPMFSVVVPVYRTPLWALERCVGSVLDQDVADWELMLCDDASGDGALSALLTQMATADPRITVTALAENGGISAATNAALARASGTFAVFLDHDDELASGALAAVAAAVAAEPEVDVLYSDEDKINHGGERYDPYFKPDWSPDLLMSYAYLCHLTVIRRSLVEEVGGLRSVCDGSQDWDLALRATERARSVAHIPEVLYHWRALPTSTALSARAKPWAFEVGRRLLADALERRGEQGEVTAEERFPGRFHVRRRPSREPLVSVIIPFRDEPAMLAACVTSIRADAGYDRYELVLVDNDSQLPETAELLDRLAAQDGVRVVGAPGPFNWPAINNAAARRAEGEVLLFMNNDIEARRARWLEALVAHAVRPEVGAVGARLLYPDGTVQHAGVIIGGNVCWHLMRFLPEDGAGYASMAISTRDCSIVTGACLMTRRDVFESVGGFDERLPLAYNDVDFCLSLRAAGYLVVYEPLAELVHYESKSRGHTDDRGEQDRILERWGPVIAAGDPYLNQHLSHWQDWCPLETPEEEQAWRSFQETQGLTPSSSSST